MAKFRLSAMVMGVAMTAIFAGNAFAINGKADCEYEGGETFDMPNGAVVCVIQIRQEEYHGEEYDGAQLGVKSCDKGVMLEDGLFCKLTLKEGRKLVTTPAEAEAAAETSVETASDKKPAMKDTGDKVIDKVKTTAKKKAAE